MRTVRNLHSVTPRPSCVTFGVFDGVHVGHQALLRRTVELASAHGLRSVALTFDPIPETLLRGARVPLLTTNSERSVLIRAAGVDLLVIAPFDRKFAAMRPVRFIREVLIGRLGARVVVAGPRTTFGRRAAGDLDLLKRVSPRLGLHVEAVHVVLRDRDQVSSTAIRTLLAQGRIGAVNSALGRPYSITGRVVAGAGRGCALGFPTANLRVHPEKMLPPDGVYAAAAIIGEERLAAAVNIGTNPTFAAGPTPRRTIEAHILVYPARPRRSRRELCGNLLGRRITLELLRRLRSERRFASIEALRQQIARDCSCTLSIYARISGRARKRHQ
jgi:riboflavin kinase/FMN adenylyltransferase